MNLVVNYEGFRDDVMPSFFEIMERNYTYIHDPGYPY